MSDHEDSQNPSAHSYGSGDQAQTSGSSSSSSSDSERPATSPQKKPVDASTCAPSSSVAQVISVAQPGDEGFILLDDRLLQTQSSVMQKAQVHEVHNLMPDGYQLTYRATWKSIIPLHAGTSIGIHYHSIKDLGEFSIHPFKVLFLETYGIMPGQLAPNGHRLLGSFINVCRFLRIPLSLRLFDHMFDVRPGSKETLGFVVVSSHQGRAFLCGLPPSNKKWKDKYVCIKFPPTAFPFTQNVWGKRMKRQVKPTEADDLVAWENTLRAGDVYSRSLPLVKFQSKFAITQIVVEEPSTARPLNPPTSQPLSLEEQSAQSHQGTSQPIHSGELYINVDTLEFDNMLGETGHASQPHEDDGEEEAAGESLQRKRRKTEEVNQPSHQGPQSSDAGKGPIVPRSVALMSRSDEELFQAFHADLSEVGRIGEEKDAQAARAHAEKMEAKWVEHCVVYRQLYAKHDGLLKAVKDADEQAQAKIQLLEAENARSVEELARLGDELEKERSERASLAAAWAVQAPEEFAAQALLDRETAIRFFQGLYKQKVSVGIVDEIGTFGYESGQYTERRALYGILEQRIQGFRPKALSLPDLHDEEPVPPFPGI
ncbi:unnamed protein product [Cuscuta campestris]|uniref:Transposase (putative) gypsy type domain-containing protein n=1 Tax=Cuscuta campestris TaxID=132261 RepID=A0A484LCM0_9ASTE|nr:unnamed protein product [Cuscuta campestris]